VVGKLLWFGESGKCCVSRQNPERDGYDFEFLPFLIFK
jgi:hypothetical protein